MTCAQNRPFPLFHFDKTQTQRQTPDVNVGNSEIKHQGALRWEMQTLSQVHITTSRPELPGKGSSSSMGETESRGRQGPCTADQGRTGLSENRNSEGLVSKGKQNFKNHKVRILLFL